MPISLSKAYEIINLNIVEAGKKMPPDVKDSLHLALDAFTLLQVLRSQGILDPSFRLKHEPPYSTDPDNHHKTTDTPAGDLAPH